MAETNRVYATISFVAVLIIVGMPLWWKTTEVYRVSLPYSRIYKLDELQIKINTTIKILCIDTNFAEDIKKSVSNAFTDSDLYNMNVHIDTASGISEQIGLIDEVDAELGDLLLVESPKPLDHEIYITSYRKILFTKNISLETLMKIVKEWIYTDSSIRTTISALSTPTIARHDAAGQRRIPSSNTYDINLSIAVPNPDKIKVEWEPRLIVEEYLQPFVSELNNIHNFTLKSQWLYFVQLDFNPKQIPDDTVLKRHYSLPEDVLPHLITPLEKKLASHTSNNPCLNFVLYVPSCESAPIYIYDKKGQRVEGELDAFLSPRWGGVVIGNPGNETCANYLEGDENDLPVYRPPTKKIMGYFLSQLRLLLGIQNHDPIPKVGVQPLINVMPRKWEMDALTRMRTIEQVTSAKLILRSLAQLLGEISNIVINDAVGASIYSAVENIELTDYHLKMGQLQSALQTSRDAFLSAEAAFTDPSLLALLYFPDDQKYAVYIPLFLPVMIPVIISLKNIWNWMKDDGKTKEKAD